MVSPIVIMGHEYEREAVYSVKSACGLKTKEEGIRG
jgi:hypothetical protein